MACRSVNLVRFGARHLGIRSRSHHLGPVVAADEKEAIETAIKQFNLEPAKRNRIVVTKSAAGMTIEASTCLKRKGAQLRSRLYAAKPATGAAKEYPLGTISEFSGM